PMFFFSSRRRHTRFSRDWSSDVCSSDLNRTCPAWKAERVVMAGVPAEAALDILHLFGGEHAQTRSQAVLLGPVGGLAHHSHDGEIGRASCRERGQSARGAGSW